MPAFRRCLAPLVLLLTLALLPSAASAQQDQVLDEIVAVVGEDVILRSDVNALVFSILQQNQGRLSYSDEIWFRALDQLIDQEVLTVHAERDTTIIVGDDQIEQGLNRRIQQMVAQIGSESRLEEMYGKSIVEIKADFRDEFRDQMLAEQLQGRKLQSIKITPSEIRTWFAQIPQDSLPVIPEVVRLSHIVRYPQVTDAARAEAREILAAIRDSVTVGGAAFEDYARQFSDDPGSAERGGQYQGMRLGEFAPEFAAVASRIAPGEISQIFETQFGLHILRVNERRGDVVDLNHILIQFDERKFDTASAVALLETVRDSAMVHGVPFEALARRHSEEEATARRGGRVVDPRSGERDLYLEALDPSWRTTLLGMQEGDISEPAEAELLDGRRAFHVIRLERRRPEHRVSLATDYELIQQYALQDKQNRVLDAWLDELREDVYIDVRVDVPPSFAGN